MVEDFVQDNLESSAANQGHVGGGVKMTEEHRYAKPIGFHAISLPRAEGRQEQAFWPQPRIGAHEKCGVLGAREVCQRKERSHRVKRSTREGNVHRVAVDEFARRDMLSRQCYLPRRDVDTRHPMAEAGQFASDWDARAATNVEDTAPDRQKAGQSA
jgi:hypothetical protein